MERNVRYHERMVRAFIGTVLTLGTALGIVGVWGWIGLLPLLSGLSGRCPLYLLFGVRSCGTDDS